MQELSFKSKPNVWAYFSVKVKSCYLIMMQFLQKRERKKERNYNFQTNSHRCFDLQSGGGIHEFSDSQFGKFTATCFLYFLFFWSNS